VGRNEKGVRKVPETLRTRERWYQPQLFLAEVLGVVLNLFQSGGCWRGGSGEVLTGEHRNTTLKRDSICLKRGRGVILNHLQKVGKREEGGINEREGVGRSPRKGGLRNWARRYEG